MRDPIAEMLPGKNKAESAIAKELMRQGDELAKAVETSSSATIVAVAEFSKAIRSHTAAVRDSMEKLSAGMRGGAQWEFTVKRDSSGFIESIVAVREDTE